MQLGIPTPKNSKILVESSVLVAASMLAEQSDIGVRIKDTFYDASQRLFSAIRRNIMDRLGITTQTVEVEAFRALQKRIEEYVQRRSRDFEDKSKLFEFGSMASNICGTRMKKLRDHLMREAIVEEEVKDNERIIKEMYQGLERSAKTGEQIEEEVFRMYPTTSAADQHERTKTQREGYKAFLERDNIQYWRLRNKHASPTDIRILAEAMHILSQYRRQHGEGFRLYMASTDSNNFVPVKDPEGESKPVTEMIRTKTGVICKWPDDILKEFGEIEEEPIIGLPQEVAKEEIVRGTEERGSSFRPCPKCGRFVDSALNECPFCAEAGSGEQTGEGDPN
jgi:hypothetical protein